MTTLTMSHDQDLDEMSHDHAGDVSNQCYVTDMPDYVNVSSLAADAGGDASGNEYMQVLNYNADDDVDNVYLSLLDIVSIAERQILVSD